MRNDIRDIRTIKVLEKVDLNFESPRMKKAMTVLGISLEECKKKDRSEFAERGTDDNVISLRHKHF
jgi:hypothetical protein